jgi:uncharacterized membrane protein
MIIENFIGVFIFMAMGVSFIIARKYLAYNVLMRNVIKQEYSEKRLKAYEMTFVVFGLIFIIIGLLILFYG